MGASSSTGSRRLPKPWLVSQRKANSSLNPRKMAGSCNFARGKRSLPNLMNRMDEKKNDHFEQRISVKSDDDIHVKRDEARFGTSGEAISRSPSAGMARKAARWPSHAHSPS